MSAETMRHEIMLAIKASRIAITGEIWLGLAFRSESELRAICSELNIRAKPHHPPGRKELTE